MEFPHGSVEMNLTRNREVASSIPGLAQLSRSRIQRGCGCGIGQRLQLPLDPLAWESPYAAGAALKRQKKDKKKKKKEVKSYVLGSKLSFPLKSGKNFT